MRRARIFATAVAIATLVLGLAYASLRAGFWNTDYSAMKLKYADVPSKFVSLDGAQLHYRDEGDGAVLILLHGSSASLHEWDPVAARLKSRFRVVRLDWPPFGLSVDSTGQYTSRRAADLLASLVKYLQLRKFVLVATSNGGNVALEYAANNPQQLQALAFSVLPISRPKPVKAPSERVVLMTWFFSHFLPNYHFKWFYRVVFEETTPSTFTISPDQLMSVYEQNNLPGTALHNAQYLAANVKMFNTDEFTRDAAGITVPVLLQWCDLDPVVAPKSKGEDARAAFKNAPVTLIHYPQTGHFPEFEAPDRFTQDLERFVDTLSTH